MSDDIVQAVAEVLRKSRLTWGTHSDRWGDTGWQRDFWGEVAEVAVAVARPLIESERINRAQRDHDRIYDECQALRAERDRLQGIVDKAELLAYEMAGAAAYGKAIGDDERAEELLYAEGRLRRILNEEPREPEECYHCGTPYGTCAEGLRERQMECCGTCKYRETHNQGEWERANE